MRLSDLIVEFARSWIRCRSAILMAFIAVALVGSPELSNADDWSNVRSQSKSSILFLKAIVRNRDGTNERVASTASGFIISGDGYFLTTAHHLHNPTPNTHVTY